MTKWCPNPFEWLDVTAWGHDTVKLSLCVESWGGRECRLAELPFPEAATLSVADIWNSQKAQQARYQANVDGQADYCRACPKWIAGDTPVQTLSDNPSLPLTSPGPRVLNLAYDRSCNLHCPSCRTHTLFHAPGSDMHAAIHAFQDSFIRPLLRTADRAFLAGLGDPFGSPCYFELLTTTQPEDAPTLNWYILTNGQGFTPENYEKIPTRGQIDFVQFSIDAACEGTYHLNRMSDWSRLLDNLEFVGVLRHTGVLSKLAISMVVQRNNYREIPAFIELATSHHCDEVLLNSLLPQGTYRDADYMNRAVHLTANSEHDEAVRVLTEAASTDGIRVMVEMPR